MPSDTFSSDTDWTVPSGIGRVQIDAQGSPGGGTNGGSGGRVVGELAVASGDTLYLRFPSDGGTSPVNSYDGGGSADVRYSGTTLSDRVAVGAGGGGEASDDGSTGNTAGGDGGPDTGQDGSDGDYTGSEGHGGTQSSGGAGGSANGGDGQAGSFGQGGAGGDGDYDGGGGGGGWYGGGGGAGVNSSGSGGAAGGGGGGSNYDDGLDSVSANERGTSTTSEITLTYISAPTNLSADTVRYRSVDLSWDAVSAADEYRVYRDGSQVGTTTNTAFTDTGLSPTTSYTYEVTAVDGGAESAKSSSISPTTGGSAPSSLSVTESGGDVSLSWTDTNADEDGYEVHRATSSGVDTSGTPLTTTAANAESYTDTAPPDGLEYYYRVVAVRNGERGNDSAERSVLVPLPAPTNLATTSANNDGFGLSWTDNADNEDGYRVEVDADNDGGWTIAADGLAANSESATVTGLLNGQLYGVRVVAYTTDTTATSGTIQATTTLPDEDQPVLGNGVEDEIAVDRESQTTNNGQIRIQTRETGESDWSSSAVGFSEQTVAFDTLTTQIFNREDGEEYEVRARSETAYVTGAYTTPVSIVTKFPGATGLSATAVSDTEVDLSWTDNADNEDGQRIVRERRAPDGDWWPERIVDDAGVNTESYTDSTAQPGREYRYRVRPFTTYTTTDSGTDTASTTAIDVPERRIPPTGPYVEIDTPAQPAPLTPTVLNEPEVSRPTNGRPEARIPVPPNDRWQSDALKGQQMRVWQDGVQQPIDTFETVKTTTGADGDEMILIGSGGRELDQYLDNIQITEQETHLAVRDAIDQYTGYGRNVDDPATDTRSDVQMLLETNSTIADIVTSPTATDPYQITQLRGLHNLQSGWFYEAEDVDFTGVQEFAEFEGNEGAWSNGSAVVLSDVGDKVSMTFSPDYEIPGGESQLRVLWAIVGSESPAFSITVDGTETDSASYDAIPIQATDKFDLNWYGWGLSSNSIDSLVTVTLEITQASDADVYVDAVFPHDRRYTYTFDETPVDGEVDGPEQYPEVAVETTNVSTVEQVVGGALDVVANTSDGLAVGVSNDGGASYTTSSGTSVQTSFGSASTEIRGRIELGRHSADDDTGLAAGAVGHEISEVDLRANLEDTPTLLDKQSRGQLDEILAAWADDADAVWTIRRDPAADPTNTSGFIFEWTLVGQRTRASDAGVISVDGSESIEGSFDQVVVFGASERVEGETFTANDPDLPRGLDEAWIKVDSERVIDPSTGTRFERGTDYLIDWREGAIEITSSGSMSAGTTYEIDYEWRYRGEYPPTSQLTNPTTADVVEDQIPAATSDREAEQLALSIYKRVQDPLVEATVTLASDPPESSLLAALSHPDLPFDGPLKLRERTPTSEGVTLRLANRETAAEVFANIREQFNALADRV